MSVQHHASLAAWLLKKPVKVLLSREESLMVHPKRHGMEMDFTTGCDEEGNLTAMKAVIYADTVLMLFRRTSIATGLYTCGRSLQVSND